LFDRVMIFNNRGCWRNTGLELPGMMDSLFRRMTMKMMKQPPLLTMLTLLAAMFMWGCGASDTETLEASQGAIRSKGDVNCMAVPTCGEGQRQVKECPAGATCEEVSLCGQTILCAEEPPVNCLAMPMCGEGQTQVEEC